MSALISVGTSVEHTYQIRQPRRPIVVDTTNKAYAVSPISC